MKLIPSCRDITHIVLAGEDRPLGQFTQVLVRAHRLFCSACNNFGKQVDLMRKANTRWRSYAKE